MQQYEYDIICRYFISIINNSKFHRCFYFMVYPNYSINSRSQGSMTLLWKKHFKTTLSYSACLSILLLRNDFRQREGTKTLSVKLTINSKLFKIALVLLPIFSCVYVQQSLCSFCRLPLSASFAVPLHFPWFCCRDVTYFNVLKRS